MNSVVIRGSIKNSKRPTSYIKDSLYNLRSWFSDEVVLSTWKDQLQYLDSESINMIDKIIVNDDPGSGPVQHFNRQLISYLSGLSNCSHDKVLVTRTDVIMKKNVFDLLDLHKEISKSKHLKIFKEKIIVSNMMTINPLSNERPNYFRVSDWVHLGIKSDLLSFGNILEHIKKIDTSKITNLNCTETLWMLCWLKNTFGDLINIYDSENINYLYDEILINNFVVLNTKSTLGMENKNWSFQDEKHPSYLTEHQYVELLKNIC